MKISCARARVLMSEDLKIARCVLQIRVHKKIKEPYKIKCCVLRSVVAREQGGGVIKAFLSVCATS